ncbi:cytochrome c-type biogenesis protein [Roseomonas sp. KE0001]|uniref:cytochrome c-type biogenesis protein n=1 Tax=Roseomonas sp. KE0001 TaxID=2479201 RepID=UPI0018DEF476|nr:cytochrome c-type biogenesis protein [Roseomonas sp. KE0001]MBI0434816.1 cytochrome c-type biogenesis protein CcmH [Roseomonas sp. KE0001]
MRRTLSALALALVLASGLSGAARAVGLPSEMLRDPAQEARAREIGRELRCLVCQNQSIEDSEADLARDLRRIVRERVAMGESDRQVMDYVHDRYGDFVLLRPPVTWATALLWGMPVLAVGGGALAILLVRRRRGAVPEAPPLSEAERARLAALEDEAGR